MVGPAFITDLVNGKIQRQESEVVDGYALLGRRLTNSSCEVPAVLSPTECCREFPALYRRTERTYAISYS